MLCGLMPVFFRSLDKFEYKNKLCELIGDGAGPTPNAESLDNVTVYFSGLKDLERPFARNSLNTAFSAHLCLVSAFQLLHLLTSS